MNPFLELSPNTKVPANAGTLVVLEEDQIFLLAYSLTSFPAGSFSLRLPLRLPLSLFLGLAFRLALGFLFSLPLSLFLGFAFRLALRFLLYFPLFLFSYATFLRRSFLPRNFPLLRALALRSFFP